MDFGKLREKSVKIGKDRKLSKHFEYFGNAGCNSLAIVMMTPDNGNILRFSKGFQIFSNISDLYRVITEFVEVH